MKLRTLLTIGISAALALAATTAVAGADTAETQGNVVKIGVLAPLDAGLVEFGTGIRNSVQLAVDEANERNAIPGWTIEVVAVNDSSEPAIGATAAAELAADPAIVGVVGPYNSGVAGAALPTLDTAGLALVSPSNTLTDLTVGADPESPVRQHDNYFRLVASDARQGPFLAASALELGAEKVAVVSETKAVSKGLADSFAAAFEAQGGEITEQQVVPDGATDFTDFLDAALPTKPDMIFFGGEYNVASTLRVQLTERDFTKFLMGGDGIKDDAFITGAGEAAEGTVASTVGAPSDTVKSAKKYLAAYDKAGYAEPPTDYGVYAFDAANLVINAVAPLLKGEDAIPADAREQVVAAIQKVKTKGASGKIAFDAYGDTKHRVFTLYKVEGTGDDLAWEPFTP
jgi:branched-chain amino acid transport system substrate-binding protein